MTILIGRSFLGVGGVGANLLYAVNGAAREFHSAFGPGAIQEVLQAVLDASYRS